MDRKPQKHSPLLRGGKALQQTVHQIISEQTSPGNRPVSRQLFTPSLLTAATHMSAETVFDGKGDHRMKQSFQAEDGMKESLKNVHDELEKHEKHMARDLAVVRSATTCCVGRVDELEQKLASQHHLVQHVLQQTHRALEQQRLLLNTQHTIIQKICSEHSSSTWWLSDAAHIGLVLYFLSTPSVRYSLWLLVHKLTPRHRYHSIVLWIVRILLFAQMLKITRATDQWLGVSQRLSSLGSGSLNMIGWVRDRLYKMDTLPVGISGAATR